MGPRAQPLVLLVDDESSFRRALGSLISRRGFDVVLAKNSSEAIRVLAARHDDLAAIVTDFAMPPGLDGVEFAHEARCSGFCGPIILTSGAPLDGLKWRADASAVDRIVAKPCTLEIVDTLNELLEKDRNKRKRRSTRLTG